MSPVAPQSCLYFGTFNPIHNGHLMIAQAALNSLGAKLGFQAETFIPSASPPHRNHETDLLDARLRFRLVELATQDNPHFWVSDVEQAAATPNYTVKTLRHLAETGAIALPVPMIIGSDALLGLASWHQPEALIEMVHFLQAPRPEYNWVRSLEIRGHSVPLNTGRIEMPALSLSSTWVRKCLQEGNTQALRYFLPDRVRQFIQNNRLYTS